SIGTGLWILVLDAFSSREPASTSLENALADLLQAGFELRALDRIGLGRPRHRLDLRGIERADHARRRADDQREFRKLLALGDDRARADHTAAPDPRTVHHDRAHADQHIVFQRAAMDDRVVADGDVFADGEGKAGIDVKRRIVLDVGALADLDPVIVAA